MEKNAGSHQSRCWKSTVNKSDLGQTEYAELDNIIISIIDFYNKFIYK